VYCAPLTTPTGGTIQFCLNQRLVGASCTSSAECVTNRCVASRCVLPVMVP
jgi:hypothetical protein